MFNIKYPWLKKYLDYFYTDKLAHSQLFSGKSGVGKSYFFWSCLNLFYVSTPLNFLIIVENVCRVTLFSQEHILILNLFNQRMRIKVIKISQLRGNGKDGENKGIFNFLHRNLISKSKIIQISSAENMNAESQNFLKL